MKQFWSDLGGKLGVGLCGAGLLLVFLGWNGAASVDRVEAQFPYLISGGLAGLALVVIGVGLIVVQNQRADRAELQATLRELKAVLGEQDDAADFQLPARRPTPERYAAALRPSEQAEEPSDTSGTDGAVRRRARRQLRADG